MIRLIYFMLRYPLHFIDFFRSSRKYLRDNKLKLIFVLLICSSCGYGQYPKLKTDSRGKVYNANQKRKIIKSPAIDSVYFTGYDSSKYYWHKYVQLQSKGVPDSGNKYLKLLNNYKSK